MRDLVFWGTWLIFGLTYLGLALGKVPGLRMDRAGIALVGATLMLVTGLISFEHALSPESIDYPTLALLFGMMVVVGFLRLSGFFVQLTGWALKRIRTPIGLLTATVLLAGILSAFLINDIICLVMTPLVLHLARRLRFDPVPYLIGLATAANIGSTGTITGNPQNIYIGSHSGIAYSRFALRLMPVALIGLALDIGVIAFLYRARMRPPKEQPGQAIDDPAEAEEQAALEDISRSRPHQWLRWKSITVALVTVLLFFTGWPLELIALGAAGLLLISRVNPDKVYRQIDWGLLVMFSALFIVVHTFQQHVVSGWGIEHWHWLLDRPVDLLSIVSAALSNLVSNVPAVLLLEPVVQAMPSANHETAWLALAMSSTFAGNLTVLGSVANLIVVENAGRHGVRISFWDYCKVGIPVTILTLALGIVWLQWAVY